MLTGHPLFPANDLRTLIENIKICQFSLPANLPGDIKDFLTKVLQKDPNLRPNISALKKQAWLRDVNWNDLLKSVVKPGYKIVTNMLKLFGFSYKITNFVYTSNNCFWNLFDQKHKR